MPIVEGLQQQTPEWLQMRCGMVTGSRVADVLAFLKKGGESAARRNYRNAVVIETLTGRTEETYVTPAMEFGIENEPLARAAYELAFQTEVETVGFAIHSKIARFGASPDGLVGTDGVLEIKCPNSSTHLEYLLGGVVPEEYHPQMLAEMACTDRLWADFVSFDPRLPSGMRFFVKRLNRDEARIEEMEKAVEQFISEVDVTIARLKAL